MKCDAVSLNWDSVPLQMFGEFYFGAFELNSVQISQRFSSDSTGYYSSAGHVTFSWWDTKTLLWTWLMNASPFSVLQLNSALIISYLCYALYMNLNNIKSILMEQFVCLIVWQHYFKRLMFCENMHIYYSQVISMYELFQMQSKEQQQWIHTHILQDLMFNQNYG